MFNPYKLYGTFWEHLFAIFFPGGFLSLEYGGLFVLGLILIYTLNYWLNRKYTDKNLSWNQYKIEIFGLFVLGLIFPPILGIFFAILLWKSCVLAVNIYNHSKSTQGVKFITIGLIFLDIIGICAGIGTIGILLYFWRLNFAYLVLSGVILGVMILIIPISRRWVLWKKAVSIRQLKPTIKISASGIMVFFFLLFCLGGFLRPYPEIPSNPNSSQTTTLSVISYNIRLGTANEDDPLDNWNNRKDYIAEYIENFDADFIAVQEAYSFQIKYILASLETRPYAYIGVGREDGVSGGEHSAILFDSSKFELLTGGAFWLSNTPFYPSKSWGGKYPCDRVCSWGRFQAINSQEIFTIFSVHYGFGSTFRAKASQLLNARVSQYAGDLPAIVMGDFNMNSTQDGYEYLEGYGEKPLRDSYSEIYGEGPHLNDTFNGFSLTYDNPTNKIDFVFISPEVEVTSCEILTDTYFGTDGREHYYSDHFPVQADLIF